jgi:hypothetical protein
MLAPISRIILRYGAGALVAFGLLDTNFGEQLAVDEDVLQLLSLALGSIVGAATEIWYMFAKRDGGAT